MTHHATPEGTRAFAQRLGAAYAPSAYGEHQGLTLSSVGLGTYLGGSDDETDLRYTAAIRRAIELGCNVLDTASNYRSQRSERVLGQVLREAFADGLIRREEVFVSTKGGFIPYDGAPPADAAKYFQERFLATGICAREDVVAGCHVLTPRFLQDQLERSLQNLGLDCIDLYYLHNPEMQLSEANSNEFSDRIHAAFAFLESMVKAGKIRAYGTATWNGYRVREGAKDYLFLPALFETAREVGGDAHHFRYLQLPVNLGMLEAWRLPNQRFAEGRSPLLSVAARLGMTVMTSGSIKQGHFASGMPPLLREELGAGTDAQRGINFTRSVPGVAVALVGMGRVEHVEENLAVLKQPRLSAEKLDALFAGSRR